MKALPVSLNPGCDYAGVVEAVRKDCRDDIQFGDRIYGLVHGANNSQLEDGAFAEYGLALYEERGLSLPSAPATEPFLILIYGGRTCHGALAIQYTKLSGLTVIATASPRNSDFVESRGADAYVLDTTALPETTEIDMQALASGIDHSEVLHYISFVPVGSISRKKDVYARNFLGYTAFGEAFDKFGIYFPAMSERYASMTQFLECFISLQDLREIKVSGRKLVYMLGDTA
ncbi:hypothetical protein BDV95DRAFT_674905 [Massariosphaeria phaeospora]|uniref:Alcohol dehydrogenase-like C-terminal domain-containing protein n=1 Tax=Massariosphaeria phaeospora TaxID=100035 RepID=A0A7C8MKT7_9PLEO|nr:hypothetical protein BDV95DRAFT_674905 [Massariosphaeria phaeospora]